MPTEQPNDAPDTLAARDRETAAAVLNDEALDRTPGGGGLGGASAADPLAGTAGPGPNAPMPDADVVGSPEREAARRATDEVTTRGGASER